VFEIIRETELLFKALDPQQQELLDIVIDGTMEQFGALVAAGRNTYIADSGLPLDVLRFKMELLTLGRSVMARRRSASQRQSPLSNWTRLHSKGWSCR
jgi:hypothetical protein